MAAFAANSVLMRLALRGVVGAPTSVALSEAAIATLFRLYAGAFVLAGISVWRRQRSGAPRATPAPDWRAGLQLFVYAAAFSVAYVELAAGTGALILFAAVQLTMIGAGLRAGERLRAVQWMGLAAALGGIAVLVAPGVEAPPLVPAATMALSGVAWGLYSVRGRGAADPVAATTVNFAVAGVLGLGLGLGLAVLAVPAAPSGAAYGAAVEYAILSGALTSGLGYVAWYAVLPSLRTTSASVVQLSVPVLAALGGVVFVAEPITARLALASLVTLGGIALVVRVPRDRGAARRGVTRL